VLEEEEETSSKVTMRYASKRERQKREKEREEQALRRQQLQQLERQLQMSQITATPQSPWTLPVSTEAAKFLANQLNIDVVELVRTHRY
jgi:hypothetical protein